MMPLVFTKATPVLLVGRGPAFEKRRALLEAAGMPLTLHATLPDDVALDTARLVFGAGLDAAEGEALAAAARARRIPVNIEDVPHLCDVHVPALIRRGNLLLTVATGGGAPAMAAALRAWLEQRFGPDWEAHLGSLAQERQRLRMAGATPPEVMRALSARIREAAWLDCPCVAPAQKR
ncbi:NAD(P)-dependent oxidoreductase [Roseococcus sp. SDR]|uniref:NAD(P)-dependent oxidoreductase n=1 Tax=Roseococcus sp. SDR TaxID=2835532 RepID=UPI001BCDB480|nr:NAD(P)-dependent oxidoreductase [Roseococcus sp. SDR]MBS7791775.1 NAD(P)-dependent oxidoreductase [Roseococcus sp. SDR]MBV1847089.1 NAD(P)-dependent oxidoreductase [Roseococcus sp. SDR]